MGLNLDVLRYDLALLYAKTKFELALKDESNDKRYLHHGTADGHLDMQFITELDALITVFGRSFKELSSIPDDGLLKKMGLTNEDSQPSPGESPLPF